jgi:hypothetical protein
LVAALIKLEVPDVSNALTCFLLITCETILVASKIFSGTVFENVMMVSLVVENKLSALTISSPSEGHSEGKTEIFMGFS